ncbi:uncharacterized protein (UPF0305 family) [Methanomicrobium sp. W14]|uniref:DUF2115 family protein n=1 Tax=Methanomicrobium sp. W14 TaxID=2817839 RepID=UPI001AE4C8AC|nr:DUF2115 family protein [Methanomicrobium sp. W14]MBP2134477.1 uncharacterized protein (UPF0305 family) [Methanomicrobium sp. W14]
MGLISFFKSVLGGGERKGRQPFDDAVINSLFLNVSGAKPEKIGHVLSKYSERIHGITIACSVLSGAGSKNQMIDVIASEVEKYPLRALSVMMKNFEEKTRYIDENYRKKLLKKIHEQIFDTYHTLFVIREKRDYLTYASGPGQKSPEYWKMVLEACRTKASHDDPYYLYLKYLLAGFRMFVLKEPAHPLGTPFPGGPEVEKDYDRYFCPLRDKADDVAFSLCPFCPAEQSSEYMLTYSAKERKKKSKNASIQNYFTNFKG